MEPRPSDDGARGGAVGIDPRLQRNYDEYYGDAAETKWRELGAIDKAANVRALCGSLKPATVLEIGAGEGALLQRLADGSFGASYFALEISASGIEAIRCRGIASLVDCQHFDGYRVPYADRAFDLAILSHVIEHVEHPRLLLNEAARVADHLFVEVPLEHNRGLPHDFRWNAVGHINFYTAQTIRLLVQSCGHEVLEQRETHPARRQYQYRLGRKGTIAYMLKELALRTAPKMAQSVWTYHSSLLIRSHRADGVVPTSAAPPASRG